MRSPRVLVVEDFEDLRKMVAFYLCGRGYEVLEAANGKQAIDTAVIGSPDAILLDLRLPDMDGAEVVRMLRKVPRTQHIPIIGWTADHVLELHQKALEGLGFIHCLEKPVTLKELESVIERFLPKPADLS